MSPCNTDCGRFCFSLWPLPWPWRQCCSASSAWASAIVTATVLTLLASIALAIECRSFWIGFAVCGTGYFAIVMTPIPPQIGDHLATSKAVTLLRDQVHPYPTFNPQHDPPSETEITLVRDWDEKATNFRWIGECIWALILGTLGGMLVRLVARRRAREPDGQLIGRS